CGSRRASRCHTVSCAECSTDASRGTRSRRTSCCWTSSRSLLPARVRSSSCASSSSLPPIRRSHMAEERWYEPGELEERSRPTMDRAIEAIEAGDPDRAVELCRGMKYEWRFLHDLMAESMLGLITFIQEQLGEDAVADAWRSSMERGWKSDTGE